MAQSTIDCTHIKSLPFSRLLYYVVAEPAVLRPAKAETKSLFDVGAGLLASFA